MAVRVYCAKCIELYASKLTHMMPNELPQPGNRFYVFASIQFEISNFSTSVCIGLKRLLDLLFLFNPCLHKRDILVSKYCLVKFYPLSYASNKIPAVSHFRSHIRKSNGINR